MADAPRAGRAVIAFDCQLTRPGFDFSVTFQSAGGITALFGPSGAGKTTVVRLLAGLDRPDRGRIVCGDEVLLDTERGIFLPPHRRRVGQVFQEGVLFPHLSVRGNLLYGRFFTKPAERRIAFDPVVKVLGLEHLIDRQPAGLSGGERQRVALGRALLASPRLLLLDEPLAALDSARKQEILPFIERLRDEFGIPIVYVSHAVEEVVRLARTVVRIEAGRSVATGTPTEVLTPTAPDGSDRFAALSLLTGEVDRHLPDYGLTIVRHPAGEITLPGLLGHTGTPLRIAVRATNVSLATERPTPISVRTILSGQVRSIDQDRGPVALVMLDLDGGDRLGVYATRLAVDELGLAPGIAVFALVKAVAIDEREAG